MIFVRNENGSHNPHEAMEIDDFMAGASLLTRYLVRRLRLAVVQQHQTDQDEAHRPHPARDAPGDRLVRGSSRSSSQRAQPATMPASASGVWVSSISN